jgi:hypothetical protein
MNLSRRDGIRNPDALVDAKRLIKAGADIEIVLIFLRNRACDQADCICAIQYLHGKPFSEAKNLVIHSRAWSDRYETDTQFREAAREAIRQLSAEPSADIPRIVVEAEDKQN